MDNNNLSIKLFNMMEIKNNSNILIIGMQNSGKSTLIRDILYHKKNSSIGAIFSKTEPLNRFYSDFCPLNTIYYDYNKYIVIDNIENKKGFYINIIDDCMSFRKDWTDQKEILDMMDKKNNCMNIFSIKYPLLFNDEFRDMFDYVFFMHDAFISNIKRLHTYAPFIDEFSNFNKIFAQIFHVNYYNIMVIDNTTDSFLIEDRIFWYKATIDLPKFYITNYTNNITISEYYGKNINSDEDDDIVEEKEDDIIVNKMTFSNNSDSSSISEEISKNNNISITINKDNIIICKNNTTVNIISI